MIIQACLNGSRSADFHPVLPMTTDKMVADALRCIDAGAAEIHVHPRNDVGLESLSAVDEVIAAMRKASPGTLVGVSTGAWIEDNPARTRDCIQRWKTPPDYASVNLSETDAPTIMALLGSQGVGVEVGLASAEDARRFVSMPEARRAFRILIEVEEQQTDVAENIAGEVIGILAAAGIARPILLHGFDATVWHFIRRAAAARFSTRVGLEDGRLAPDGAVVEDNAELVRAAMSIFRQQE